MSFLRCVNYARDRTVDEAEVGRFSAAAHAWWDEGGEFKALHTMNNLRVPLIRDALTKDRDISSLRHDKILQGLRVLDVGCGGGILSEVCDGLV